MTEAFHDSEGLASSNELSREYRAALHELEAENTAEHARIIADLMSTRIEDMLLDRSSGLLYESDGEYDQITGDAIRNVLKDHAGDPAEFKVPTKRYKEGAPVEYGKQYDTPDGRVIVRYTPYEGPWEFDDQGRPIPKEPGDWRVKVNFAPWPEKPS